MSFLYHKHKEGLRKYKEELRTDKVTLGDAINDIGTDDPKKLITPPGTRYARDPAVRDGVCLGELEGNANIAEASDFFAEIVARTWRLTT